MRPSDCSRFRPLRRKCHVGAIALFIAAIAVAACAQTPADQPAASAKSPAAATTPDPVSFDDFFVDKALRLEMYQTGDARDEVVTLHRICSEPIWPENPRALICPFELGRYAIKVYDAATDRLIYTKGFDTMFAEYRTTKPAIDGTKRVFQTTVRIPEPKKPVRVSFERRDKYNALSSIFTTQIDPADYHIVRESEKLGDKTFIAQKSGEPHDCVDLAFISEGYTAADEEKFKADVEKMSAFMFSVDPYKNCRNKFNVYGVFRPSAERGMDEPRQHSYRSTVLDASYNSFDLDRYLLTENNHELHRMAAQVPYDTIVILVNTPRYGGGSICLDYCISSVDNATSPRVFVHEFGHSFAYLADEYVGTVAYNDRYPLGVEPLEANITELLDRDHIKWKKLLTPGVTLPTTDGKAEVRALQSEFDAAQKKGREELAAAETNGVSAEDRKAIADRNQAREQETQDKLTKAKAYVAGLGNTVGAFEGAGYMAKGMYRPQFACWMGNGSPTQGFCPVCQQGIRQMIEYYAPEK